MGAFLASRLGGWVVGGVVTALAVTILGVMLLLAKADIKVLKANIETLDQQKITLEGAIETQQTAIGVVKDVNAANQIRLSTYEQKKNESDLLTTALRNEINELRSTEEAAALNAPFERADAARARIDRSLQRFADRPKIKNDISTNTERADDTGRASNGGDKNPEDANVGDGQ